MSLMWEGRKESPWPSAVGATTALNIIREASIYERGARM